MALIQLSRSRGDYTTGIHRVVNELPAQTLPETTSSIFFEYRLDQAIVNWPFEDVLKRLPDAGNRCPSSELRCV